MALPRCLRHSGSISFVGLSFALLRGCRIGVPAAESSGFLLKDEPRPVRQAADDILPCADAVCHGHAILNRCPVADGDGTLDVGIAADHHMVADGVRPENVDAGRDSQPLPIFGWRRWIALPSSTSMPEEAPRVTAWYRRTSSPISTVSPMTTLVPWSMKKFLPMVAPGWISIPPVRAAHALRDFACEQHVLGGFLVVARFRRRGNPRNNYARCGGKAMAWRPW